MEDTLQSKDLTLKEAFDIIITKNDYSEYLIEIVDLIRENKANRKSIKDVLLRYSIYGSEYVRNDFLDLIITYVNLVLDDHTITNEERKNIQLLKMMFEIKPGDFYKYRYNEIENILHKQFKRLYSDNVISIDEALQEVKLQEMFDLGYDQYDKFKENELQRAINEGADITELNTARQLKKE